jgi:hypothetical protein
VYRTDRVRFFPPTIALLIFYGSLSAQERPIAISLPDSDLVTGYEQAAVNNVLRALNRNVFFGYWSVCADGQGFGYGNTYPSLDGHQLSDALLLLGEVEVVKANWAYVRSFQRQDGLLPLAILPSLAGKKVGKDSTLATVAVNGGLYEHWVPGNPLGALASPTYIQNADVIYRYTLDRDWLLTQLPSINRAADYLASLTTEEGTVKGAGYYLERPARIESDGVTQCYAVDAFRRAAELNVAAGDSTRAKQWTGLAERISHNFTTRFWAKDHFAEYLHPTRGFIATHGLTDVDWAAIATGVATAEQQTILWPKLKDEERFHYGGMPTGISTRPETYEDWEFTVSDRHDLAVMGRVWYLESWARAHMGDAEGLLDGLHRVIRVGRANGFSWHERYEPDGHGGVQATGPDTYCEYPANLIRIVQRFLLGVDLRLDGSLVLAPTATELFWRKGFGQTLSWRDRTLCYWMKKNQIKGEYTGSAQQLVGVRFSPRTSTQKPRASIDGQPVPVQEADSLIFVTLPPTKGTKPHKFEILQ